MILNKSKVRNRLQDLKKLHHDLEMFNQGKDCSYSALIIGLLFKEFCNCSHDLKVNHFTVDEFKDFLKTFKNHNRVKILCEKPQIKMILSGVLEGLCDRGVLIKERKNTFGQRVFSVNNKLFIDYMKKPN